MRLWIAAAEAAVVAGWLIVLTEPEQLYYWPWCPDPWTIEWLVSWWCW